MTETERHRQNLSKLGQDHMSDTKDQQPKSAIERAIERLAEAPRPAQAAKPAAASAPSPIAPVRESPPVVDLPSADAAQVLPRVVRKIDIDLGKLESQGIFSPGRAPNRTTEEFRLIKRVALLNIQAAKVAGSKNTNLIMVTSSRQKEGKSFVSLNLALSLAVETDTTVLLIDADPSRASVLGRLEVKADRGFLDLLRDPDLDYSDVVMRTNLDRLAILPSGNPDPLSTELLAGSAAANLLEEVSQRYPDRIVILDASPALATSEPSALSLHVGQIVFVVDAGSTSKSAIKESLNLIGACPNIGFVLNRAEPQFGSAHFGSYYGYYKKSYKKYYKSFRK